MPETAEAPGHVGPFRKVYRPLTAAEAKRVEDIKAKAEELYDLMTEMRPDELPWDDRCMAIGRQKVEEAVMWGTKALTA